MTWWSKLHSLCPEEIFEVFFNFSQSLPVFSWFPTLRNTFWIFCETILVGLSKLFSKVHGRFRKNIFLKTNSLNCLILFGLWAQKLRIFGNIFSTDSSKQHSLCPVEVFDFSTKLYEFFHSLRAVRKIIWHFRCTRVNRFVRTAFYAYERDFSGNFDILKKKFSQLFRVLIKTSKTFVKNKSAKCQKMHFRAFQRIFFGTVIFFLGKKSCLSTEVEEEGFWKSVKSLDRFVQTAFYVSKGDFCANCFF